MPEPIIQLNSIVKNYDNFRALDGVTLEVGAGITGLLGPNGAGKSTLIKVLLGLVKLSAGEGSILGHPLSASLKIRSLVGYMPEDDCILPRLTGIESIQLAAQLSSFPRIEALRRAHEILDFCGIEQERYREVDTYSTGMRQGLRFAQAIVHDPPLLILDEPTSGLDPEERYAMLQRIKILATRSKKTVLLCTHILPDVQHICDAVVILANGKVRLSGKLEELQRPSSDTVQVHVLGDSSRFLEEINRSGAQTTKETNGCISVHGLDGQASETIWRAARETETSIRSVSPAINSLEQIFLEAVTEGRNAGS